MQKIYIAKSGGFDPLNDKGKSICRFSKFQLYDSGLQRMVIKGYLITENPKIIKFLEEHPLNGKDFKETTKIPLTSSNSENIIAGVVSANVSPQNGEAGLKADPEDFLKANADMVKEITELGLLRAKLFKTDGNMKQNGYTEEDKAKYNFLNQKYNQFQEIEEDENSFEDSIISNVPSADSSSD